jgi:hypothetical protein
MKFFDSSEQLFPTGVPPIFEYIPFSFMFDFVWCQRSSVFNQIRGPPSFAKVLYGAMNQKKLKNTALETFPKENLIYEIPSYFICVPRKQQNVGDQKSDKTVIRKLF